LEALLFVHIERMLSRRFLSLVLQLRCQTFAFSLIGLEQLSQAELVDP